MLACRSSSSLPADALVGICGGVVQLEEDICFVVVMCVVNSFRR